MPIDACCTAYQWMHVGEIVFSVLRCKRKNICLGFSSLTNLCIEVYTAAIIIVQLEVGSLLLNTRPIGPSVTKHIRHITNKVTAD